MAILHRATLTDRSSHMSMALAMAMATLRLNDGLHLRTCRNPLDPIAYPTANRNSWTLEVRRRLASINVRSRAGLIHLVLLVQVQDQRSTLTPSDHSLSRQAPDQRTRCPQAPSTVLLQHQHSGSNHT